MEKITFTYETARPVYVPSRPMTFDEFLDTFGSEDDVELIDGVAVQKMAAQYDHEKFYVWLLFILGGFVTQNQLGEVLGSRTPIEITNFRGRLPDILFVAQARLGIIRQKAIYGAPDLVIEIVSPHDRPSDIASLETDYRSIGVAEIVFIDQRQRRVRVLTRDSADIYTEQTPIQTLTLSSVPGFSLTIADFWASPRPDYVSVLLGLLP